MEYYLLIARSVTQAQHMARELDKCGVRSGILRAPAGLTNRGCSYVLRIRAEQWNVARPCLEKADLKPLGIYSNQGNVYREVIQ